MTAFHTHGHALKHIGNFLWKWSPFARNAHRSDDETFAGIWTICLDERSIRETLNSEYPEISTEQLPATEEAIRLFLRDQAVGKTKAHEGLGETDKSDPYHDGMVAEECDANFPEKIRYLLAALNAGGLEKKLRGLVEREHPAARGIARIHRSRGGTTKIFNAWRNGYHTAVGAGERTVVQVFFWFLLFCNIFPNVAAGFLGERGYNVRQTGVRVVTLIQWCYLYTFDYPMFWLLFQWSLERLIGALLGNVGYAFAAAIPVVHEAYYESWFKNMLLGLSTAWQISIQFYFPARDYVERLMTRRQMAFLRGQAPHLDWKTTDTQTRHELVTLMAFNDRQARSANAVIHGEEIPVRVRIERLLQFSNTFKFGRPMDMLVGILKDDLENLINVYEDYLHATPNSSKFQTKDMGHLEPRWPKWLLVFFDIAIFAYICYSFVHQPFNFNTVVAYGVVVILKQMILALKRYQTVKAAQRLFTNMTAFNVWGIFLVSVPVTVDRNVFDDDAVFAGLLVGMTVTTVFLTEPLAPLFQAVGEVVTNTCARMAKKWS